MIAGKNVHAKTDPASVGDEKRLLPMLIAGIVLIVAGMVAVMWFV